ncbi:hypothetical protein BC835DRAFT_1417672 [Cytidiella melzeri]|nr:hypothetical protein BC835DRAFT_1417672 [Cytidiella melzeri]
MTEPLCFRAEVDRLLAQPDFAGLARQQSESASSAGYFSRAGSFNEAMDDSSEPEAYHSSIASQEVLTDLNGSEFEPMDFVEEDSGFAEASVIRDEILAAPSPERLVISTHVHHRFPGYLRVATASSDGSKQQAVESTSQEAYSHLETSTGAGSSHSTTSLSRLSPDAFKLPLASPSPRTIRSAMHSVDDQNKPNFLERMIAKYPLVSASICSDSPSSRLSAPSPSHTAFRLSQRSSSFGRFADFVFDITSRPTSPTDEDEAVSVAVEVPLLDAVEGKLFENSDPWAIIKGRLSCSPHTAAESLNATPYTEDTFIELRKVVDRRGVGFHTPPPRRSPLLDLQNASTPNPVLRHDDNRTCELPSLKGPIFRSSVDDNGDSREALCTVLNAALPESAVLDLDIQASPTAEERQTSPLEYLDLTGTQKSLVPAITDIAFSPDIDEERYIGVHSAPLTNDLPMIKIMEVCDVEAQLKYSTSPMRQDTSHPDEELVTSKRCAQLYLT